MLYVHTSRAVDDVVTATPRYSANTGVSASEMSVSSAVLSSHVVAMAACQAIHVHHYLK